MTPATKNKIVYGVIAAAAIGLFLIGRGCGIRSVLKTAGSDTTIYKDSIKIIYQPTPYKVVDVDTMWLNGVRVIVYTPVHDTIEVLQVRIDTYDTAALLARIKQISFYDTTVNLKADTVRIQDTVSMNRITGRAITIKSEDTTTKTTIVLKPPQRLIVSFGLSAIGSLKDPFYMAGVDLSLKTPNDRQYIIGTSIDKKGTLYGEVGVKWPIRFGKRD